MGMASTTKANKKPMALNGHNMCKMTEHLLACHKGELAQEFVTITILEVCPSPEVAKERETIWTYDLFAFYPTGLNEREEVQFN